jgi:hypothetical protein
VHSRTNHWGDPRAPHLQWPCARPLVPAHRAAM